MAKVNFKRIQNSNQIDNLPVEDGAFIVTGDGKSYIDYDNDRIPTNGTLDSEMSDTSRNAVENKVVKEYVDGTVTDAINGLQYNLVKNGPPVKTGRKVDGQDEYIKYITSTAVSPNGNPVYIPLELPDNVIHTIMEIWIGSGTFMVPNMWYFNNVNYFRCYKSANSTVCAELGSGADWFRSGMKIHIIVRYFMAKL